LLIYITLETAPNEMQCDETNSHMATAGRSYSDHMPIVFRSYFGLQQADLRPIICRSYFDLISGYSRPILGRWYADLILTLFQVTAGQS